MKYLRSGCTVGLILHCNMTPATTLEQLTGRHARLRAELTQAFTAPAWRVGQIDRLADDLAETERLLTAIRPVDEQTDDPMLGFAW